MLVTSYELRSNEPIIYRGQYVDIATAQKSAVSALLQPTSTRPLKIQIYQENILSVSIRRAYGHIVTTVHSKELQA